MKLIIIIALCLAFLSAGCVEQKSGTNDIKSGTNAADRSQESLALTITGPKAGDILQGNEDVSFGARVIGGERPLSYKWISSIDGELSTSQSFNLNPSKLGKGSHIIILEVTDARGNSEQGTIQIEVM